MSELSPPSLPTVVSTSSPILKEAPLAQVSVKSTLQTRWWSGLLFTLCAMMLGLGAWMTPSSKGLGTHAENLHLPPCYFYMTTGIPCPTCGCTTAVTWAAHGHVAKAFVVQPFGAMVAVMGMAGLVLGFMGVLTGRWFGPSAFYLQWHWLRLLIGGGALLLAGWGYKIYAVTHGF